MTYPRELIDKVKTEFSLNDEECAELSSLLQEPGVQVLIESGALKVEGILYTDPRSLKKLMMSKVDLARLVANQTKIDALKNPAHPLKLSDLYFWVTPEGAEAFCYTIHPSLIENLKHSAYIEPLKNIGSDLPQLYQQYPNFKELENEIDHIIAIRNTSSKRTAAFDFISRQGIENLENFFNFFMSSHPILLLRKDSLRDFERYLKQSGPALRAEARKFYTEKFRAAGESISNITFSAKK